ncbi:zinc-dependent alcohol dehydrogenase family protein [Ornithinimicrobium sediminis]|uniref:zinc-dependent alcohol dehydrogenase family protein n=1 Tax=Ornithinimicrobium sediminis TaxID=2904603 RepID=UPI001E30701A|nr:zinc-dependent alcohol dehydrogenase family protein [Ornithinimicrobium sediminis]MCE0487485.1 zinc-dependent alcohol dehydrogenase family protein [Ornithinimicrobium sediminis]
MKATLLHAPGDIRIEQVPDPGIVLPTDALVRVTASCVCGSDLWPYRGVSPVGRPRRIGHEFVGVVVEVGSEVRTLRAGDFVVAPFTYSDNTCPHCRAGVHTACAHGGGWGSPDEHGHLVDGGQGEWVRVPQADGTLVAAPEAPDEALLPAMLALSDVMGTGWHAAVSARVKPGDTVVVVGDGAVGLCGVLAATRMGAERVVAMSRHAPRQAVARAFGAAEVVAERGEEGVAAVKELTGGVGADAVLECVGTGESMQQAFDSLRPGGTVGYVGVPHGVEVPIRQMFGSNLNLAGGVAPVRHYLEQLRDDVLAGAIDPGAVFDLTLPLDDVAEAYAAMDERRAIKVMLRP